MTVPLCIVYTYRHARDEGSGRGFIKWKKSKQLSNENMGKKSREYVKKKVQYIKKKEV